MVIIRNIITFLVKIYLGLSLSKKIVTDKFEITLIEKGIVWNNILPNAVIYEKEIIEMKNYNIDLCENKPYTMLITTGHLSDTTKEARELTAQKDFNNLVMARALLTDSIGHRLVANFYLAVNKPFVKTKLFSDREKALEWLREIIK